MGLGKHHHIFAQGLQQVDLSLASWPAMIESVQALHCKALASLPPVQICDGPSDFMKDPAELMVAMFSGRDTGTCCTQTTFCQQCCCRSKAAAQGCALKACTGVPVSFSTVSSGLVLAKTAFARHACTTDVNRCSTWAFNNRFRMSLPKGCLECFK